MELSEFIKIVDKKISENPFWFDDESDSEATDDLIMGVEKKLGIKLPVKYKEFVKKYGGGYFAFVNVFSVNEDSEWFIVERNNKARSYLPSNFVAISDDEAGGLYGYLVHKDICREEVYYWDHESNSISEKMYDDLLEYIVMVGLTN